MKQQPRTTVPVFMVEAAIPKERMGDYLEFLALTGTMEGLRPLYQQEGKSPVHALVAAQQQEEQVLALEDQTKKKRSPYTAHELILVSLHKNGGTIDNEKLRAIFKEDSRSITAIPTTISDLVNKQGAVERIERGVVRWTPAGKARAEALVAQFHGAAQDNEPGAPPAGHHAPAEKKHRTIYSIIVEAAASLAPDQVITNKKLTELVEAEGHNKRSLSPQVFKAKQNKVLAQANGKAGEFHRHPKFKMTQAGEHADAK